MMNLKSKLFGLGIASVMMLASTAGISAQNSSAPVEAEFVPGNCTITAAAGASLQFGPFTWNGTDAYEVPAGGDSDQVQFAVTVPGPDQECSVTFSLLNGGLTSGVDTIPASDITIKPNNTPGSAQSLTGATYNLGSDTTYAHSVLTQYDDVQPGNYSGTLNMVINAGV